MFLETQRTALLPPTESERDLFSAIAVEIYSDSGVMKYLGGAMDPEEIRGRYKGWVEHWERHGFGLCMVKWKATGEIVGAVNLLEMVHEGENCLEMGWMILPRFQGQGITTEVTRALVAFANAKFPKRAIVAFSHPENAPSTKICERLGFKRMNEFTRTWLDRELPCVYWRLG